MTDDPNQFTVRLDGMPVQLTLQAQPGSVAFGRNKAIASSGVRIIAKADNPEHGGEINRILCGISDQNVIRELTRRLNRQYLSIETDNHYQFKTKFFRKLRTYLDAFGGRELVILRPPLRKENTMVFDIDLPVILDKTTNTEFLTSVRHTLNQIIHEREPEAAMPRVYKKQSAEKGVIPEDQWTKYLENTMNARNTKGRPEHN